MNVNSMYWMQYSIDISKKVSPSLLQVGTVLVSEQNKLLCSAYSGETCNESWYFVLLRKIQKLKISHAQRGCEKIIVPKKERPRVYNELKVFLSVIINLQ